MVGLVLDFLRELSVLH